MRGLIIGLVAAIAVASIASAANVATINFAAVKEYTDGTLIPTAKPVTYELYQGVKGAARVKVGAFTSGGQITTGLLTGNEYCWHVTATIDGSTSAPSNEACKRFTGTPEAVTITVT